MNWYNGSVVRLPVATHVLGSVYNMNKIKINKIFILIGSMKNVNL